MTDFLMNPSHSFTFRVCYADTDAGGVIYYGNYMRYLEQGRTDLLRQLGWKIEDLHEAGIIFPVREMNVVYKSPGRLGEILRVTTRLIKTDRFSLLFHTEIQRSDTGQAILEAQVKNVCISPDGKLRKLPDEMRQALDEQVGYSL